MSESVFTAAQLREKMFARLPVLGTEGACPVPNQRFWDFYRENRTHLEDACIGVRKTETDQWLIVAYPFEDPQAKEQRLIDEMLTKHPVVCPTCCTDSEIERHVMTNGAIQFKYFCVMCYSKRGGALPHYLVDYLCKEYCVRIFDREGDGIADVVSESHVNRDMLCDLSDFEVAQYRSFIEKLLDEKA